LRTAQVLKACVAPSHSLLSTGHAISDNKDGAGDTSRYCCYGQDSIEGIHDTMHNILAGPWTIGTDAVITLVTLVIQIMPPLTPYFSCITATSTA